MTALKQYERLESEGLWRADKDAQRRDVLVSFGNATLVVSDAAGRPLTHWSLPAVLRLNEGERPALFSTDETGDETLEIADPLMIDAIEKVRKTLLRAQPHPGRLRNVLVAASVLLVLALAVFWFPNAAEKQTLAVVPQSKRVEIGTKILSYLEVKTGERCSSNLGQQALSDLKSRILGTQSNNQIVVLPSGVTGVQILPGGITLLDRGLLENHDDPMVAAGFILLTQTPTNNIDPLSAVLDSAGVQATVRLLTTGGIDDEYLRTYADQVFLRQMDYVVDESLAPTFDLANVPLDAIAPLIGAEQIDQNNTNVNPQILNDNAWIALRGICDS